MRTAASRRRSHRFGFLVAIALAVLLAAGGAGVGAGSASGVVNYTVSLTLSQATADLNNHGAITVQARLTLSGQPQMGVQVNLSSTPNDDTFSPHPYCTTDGNGFCNPVTLIPGTTVGNHTITATFTNPVGSGTDSKTFCQYYTPTSIALSFPNGANRLAPDGGATTANILVRDANQQGVPCQSVSLTTSDTSSNKVAITTPTGVTNGNYTSTITAPVVPLSSPPTWSGSGVPDQTLTATVSGVAPTSQALHIAYPTFHTKQTPDPSPGLYDELNRPVRLTGVNGVFMGDTLADGQDKRTNGGGVYHMASPKFLPFDAAPNDTQANVTNSSWNSSIVRFQVTDVLWCATDAACDTPTTSNGLIGTCGDRYRQNLQAMINKVTQLGMVAEVSLARVGALSQPPTTALTCFPDNPIDETDPSAHAGGWPMADYAYAPTFWQQLAAQNANNPLVAFEFYNEPYLHNANPACPSNRQGMQTVTPGESPHAVWMNAGLAGTPDANDTVQYTDTKAPYNVTYSFRAAGMQLMYNAVRAVAPNNLVFVNGSGEKIGDPDECNENQAYDLSPVINGFPVAGGTNVIYGSHPYYGSNCANNGSGVHDGTDSIPGLIVSGFPPNLQSAVFDTAAQYPVAFTEFGATCLVDSEAANFNQGIIADAEIPANHVVAWAAFQFMDKNMEGANSGAAPYYLIQCTEDQQKGCQGDASTNFQPYNWYQASQRGLPVYNTLKNEPSLK